MTFDFNMLTGIISIMTFVCMWLFLRPQQIENESIHKSLDRMTDAISKLRDELKASSDDRSNMRTNIKTLFHKHDEIKGEISEMRKDVKEELDELRRTTCSHCDGKKNHE